ncbi:MAG: YCF48-related protein [Bryobacterales bacterium]|nr:YCF48-related protein [Bryobacteraceae bacterium]MDW8355240.1 YCF48-related protein [Bryobacterales bacterium]
MRYVWVLCASLSLSHAAELSRAPCRVQHAAAAGEVVWLLCEQGRLFVSEDAGRSWSERRIPAEGLRAAALFDARRGLVAGERGAVFLTEDHGRNWRRLAVPTEETLTAIHVRGEQAWICGYGGVMLHSADGGRTWVKQNTGILVALESVYFADERHGWAVGWVGTILRTTDGGQTWEPVKTSAAMWSLAAVYFRDPQNGWIVGRFGQILRSRDGGLTWQAQESPVRTSLTSILFDAAGRGWITADSGLLVSEDGGETWRTALDGDWYFLNRLISVGSSLWAVGPFDILKREPKDVA